MVHAFIMIRTGAGTSREVSVKIRDIGTVGESHVVAGQFDVIAEVHGTEVYDILSTASEDIQTIHGVEETKTYVSLSA